MDIQEKLYGNEFISLNIEPLTASEDQEEFLENYAAEISAAQGDKNNAQVSIIQKFQDLNQQTQNCLESPILLLFFVYLCLHSETLEFHNENDIYEDYSKHVSKEIQGKIKYGSKKALTRNLMEKIADLSLEMIKNHKYFVSPKELENFERKFRNEKNTLNDFDSLFSSLLIPEYRSQVISCLLYTSPSPRDKRQSRMPSSA